MTARLFALIPAAGTGARFGGDRPKQYAAIGGTPMLRLTLDRLAASLDIAALYVAIAADDPWAEATIGQDARVRLLRCGGATRAETVARSLGLLSNAVAPDDWLLVHDAARPCVSRQDLVRLTSELAHDVVGGLLALAVTDTLKRADRGKRVAATVPREGLWQAQTPQMFRYRVLCAAFRLTDALAATDEAQAVEALGATHRPRLVRGSATNIKVTVPEDIALAEAILAMEKTSEVTR